MTAATEPIAHRRILVRADDLLAELDARRSPFARTLRARLALIESAPRVRERGSGA